MGFVSVYTIMTLLMRMFINQWRAFGYLSSIFEDLIMARFSFNPHHCACNETIVEAVTCWGLVENQVRISLDVRRLAVGEVCVSVMFLCIGI